MKKFLQAFNNFRRLWRESAEIRASWIALDNWGGPFDLVAGRVACRCWDWYHRPHSFCLSLRRWSFSFDPLFFRNPRVVLFAVDSWKGCRWHWWSVALGPVAVAKAFENPKCPKLEFDIVRNCYKF